MRHADGSYNLPKGSLAGKVSIGLTAVDLSRGVITSSLVFEGNG